LFNTYLKRQGFIGYHDDVLRFMTDSMVPFTNNDGENDIRMSKVQPLSHLRLIAGTKALVGLLMIGWTTAFLLLEMQVL